MGSNQNQRERHAIQVLAQLTGHRIEFREDCIKVVNPVPYKTDGSGCLPSEDPKDTYFLRRDETDRLVFILKEAELSAYGQHCRDCIFEKQ